MDCDLRQDSLAQPGRVFAAFHKTHSFGNVALLDQLLRQVNLFVYLDVRA